jgi:uncharacterized protein
MNIPSSSSDNRILIVDSMRGMALMGILLLHSVEQWGIFRYPEHASTWLSLLNRYTFQFITFLFAGKAYAIFSLLFGLSFFIILDRWSKQEINFRGKFLWRLCILAILGYLHGIIYFGDILLFFAIVSIPLLFLYKLSNKVLISISVALMIQIPSLWQMAGVFFEQGGQPPQPYSRQICGELLNVFANGSFHDVCITNIWEGLLCRIFWFLGSDKPLQMIGLFIWGFLIGRSRIFEDKTRTVWLAKRALLLGIAGFSVFFFIRRHIGVWGLMDMHYYMVFDLVTSYRNLTQMIVMSGGFILLYQWAKTRSIFDLLAPYGRMSLTSYVTQSIIGVPLFYGYGFAIYHYLGAFYSIFIGITILMIQCAFAHYWFKRYYYGPVEWLWRSFTFLNFKIPFRKI